MRNLIALLAVGSLASAATFTIDAGKTRFGNTSYTQSSAVTVTTTGAPAAASEGFVYVDVNGQLNISLPPGVSGACSGAPCRLVSTDSVSASDYSAGAHAFAATASDALYFVDPIFSATASQANSYSLFANVEAPLTTTGGEGFSSGAVEADQKFTVTQSGYIVGIRFYRPTQDTTTDQVVTLYNNAGTALSPSAGTGGTIAGTGWQTIYFASPVLVSPATTYRASLHSNGGVLYRNGFLRNYSVVNGALLSAAAYNGGNGASCGPQNTGWPQTTDGYTSGGTGKAVAILGCVAFGTDGSATATNNANGSDGGSNSIGSDTYGGTEGCQCVLAGYGPGPYTGINTFIEGSGNMWHHDDGSGNRYMGPRGDYYYYRMTWRWPKWVRYGSADSDGFDYYGRQLVEWKGGRRIYIGGSLFEGAHNEVAPSSVMAQFGNQTYGVNNVNVEYSEFRHGPGVTQMGNQYQSPGAPPLAIRERFAHNLIWDVGGYAGALGPTGRGWVIEYLSGAEDFQFDHNTILPLRGELPSVFWSGAYPTEGVKVTNNIYPIGGMSSAGGQNFWGGGGDGQAADASCNDRSGEKLITTCISSQWANYQFHHNLLYPSDWTLTDAVGFSWLGWGRHFTYASTTTAAQIATYWPTIAPQNYVPSATDLTTYGWYSLFNTTADTSTWAKGMDARLKPGSLVSAGNHANYPATDGKDLGADLAKLRDMQGKVEHIGVPASTVTTTSAQVVFNAPDSQGCPVDYKIYDPTDPYTVSGFTRVADTGTGRARQVTLSGLTTATTYQYRVDCAVDQPTGIFRTK